MILRDTERDELVAALHQISTFGQALQQLNERLLDALASGASRPDAEEIDDIRAGPQRPRGPWRRGGSGSRA